MKKYDTYKDSGIQWIGQVPEHWAITRIKFLANAQENSFADGDWIESPYVTDSGIRYLTSGNIGNGCFKKQGNGHITEETFQKLNCKFAYPGDLVFCRLNQPFGRSCILPNDQERYVIAVDNVILRTNEDKRYICYITQLERYQNHIGMQANGTAMQRISRTKLGNVHIPLPPLSEQEAIANFLDKKTGEIDKAISLFEREKLDLQAYRKAIISETVTKGLNPNAKLKDSGIQWIGQIPEEWSVVKMKYCFEDIYSGDSIRAEELDEEGKYPVYGGGAIISHANKYNVCAGDIIIGRVGANCGCVTYLTQNAWATDNALVVKSAIDSRYLFHQLIAADLNSLNSSNAQPLITASKVKDVKFACPKSISGQKEIAEYIDKKTSDIDTAIERINAQITELQAYRTALISEAVTGKIDVR